MNIFITLLENANKSRTSAGSLSLKKSKFPFTTIINIQQVTILTGFPHDEHVPTALLVREEDVWDDDEDAPSFLRLDAPHAVHVVGVVTRVVGAADDPVKHSLVLTTRVI
jgi:hypothetical protein